LFYRLCQYLDLHSFPTRRSSDLYTIHGSNLCSEIMLPSKEDESFVCCLSSLNLETYDEWKDSDTVRLAIFFLDAVMQEFIVKTEDRKSTRLNSSHVKISYAVFCL